MYKITDKTFLNSTIVQIKVEAPLIASKIKAGQFVILRVDENGERVPFTVADANKDDGTITVIFQVLGATTRIMSTLEAGQFLQDVTGPLGKQTHLEGIKKAIVVGGGSGCAIAYPIAKALKENGAQVSSISGFRTKDLVIMQDAFNAISEKTQLVTDDGTAGRKGLVTNVLEEWLEADEYDAVIAIGPLPMMKFVCKVTEKYSTPTIVSMNSIMIDGTGMCGCCRLTVGGKTKFACVDGPDFNGHEVDFDEAISRMSMYTEFEKKADEHVCNLLKQGGAEI